MGGDREVTVQASSISDSVYKSIAIPLYGYKPTHQPYEKWERMFVGRESIRKSLEGLLDTKENMRGTYLVSGYRGSGKTSIIKTVVETYREENPNLIVVPVNLGNEEDLTAHGIYYSTANILLSEIKNTKKYEQYEEKYVHLKKPSLNIPRFYLKSMLTLLAIFLTVLVGTTLVFEELTQVGQILEVFKYVLGITFLLGSAVLYGVGIKALNRPRKSLLKNEEDEVHDKIRIVLDDLNDLIDNMTSEVKTHQSFGNSKFPAKYSVERTARPVRARDAEQRLIRILQDLSREALIKFQN